MALKTHFSSQKGVTIVELLIILTVGLFLITATVLVLRPGEFMQKSRDNKRFSDLSLIERVVTEYKLDYGVYPDTSETLRTSITLPSGSTSLASPESGWIAQNLSSFSSRLPLDPLNEDPYFYSYIHNNETFELNVNLEYYLELELDDNGNDSALYELGTNLTLISP